MAVREAYATQMHDGDNGSLPLLYGLDGATPSAAAAIADPLCASGLVAASHEYRRVHGYVVVLVCSLGILANFANIVVLTRKKMRSAVNRLLAALAGAELSLMCVYLPAGVVYNLGAPLPGLTYFRADRSSLYYALFHVKFAMVCHSVAVWETIAVATFRYVHLRFPARGRRFCSQRNANIATAVIVAACSLLSVPNWLSDGVVEARGLNLTAYPHCLSAAEASEALGGGGGGERTLWTIGLTDWARAHPDVHRANYWLQSVVVRLLPTALLAVLTVLLVGVLRAAEAHRRRLMHSRGRDENRRAAERSRTTGMLLVAVVLALCVEVPHGAYMIVMLADGAGGSYESAYELAADFIDMAALLAQALNFFLYTSMSAQFRHTFLSLFCCCCRWTAKQADAEWLSALGRRSIELQPFCTGGGGPTVHGPFSDTGASQHGTPVVGRTRVADAAASAVEEERLLAATRASNGERRTAKGMSQR